MAKQVFDSWMNSEIICPELILQKKILLSKQETTQTLEKKIRYLEFEYFPKNLKVIKIWVIMNRSINNRRYI